MTAMVMSDHLRDRMAREFRRAREAMDDFGEKMKSLVGKHDVAKFLAEFKPLPRWRIPWDAPQFWRQNWNPIDFPYCRGKLAAHARTLKWLVKSKPCRAEPRQDRSSRHPGFDGSHPGCICCPPKPLPDATPSACVACRVRSMAPRNGGKTGWFRPLLWACLAKLPAGR